MIKTVVLQMVKNEEKVSRNGKKYTACSLKIADNWVNGFGNEQTRSWEAGQQVTLDLYEEEYEGKMYKKFKTLDKADLLEQRVKKLEQLVSELMQKGNYTVTVPQNLTTMTPAARPVVGTLPVNEPDFDNSDLPF